MLIAIITWVVFGLLVGLVARALVPGRQSLGMVATTGLGIVGSFIGGILGNLLMGGEVLRITPAGFIGSVLGAILVLAATGLFRGRHAHV